MARLTPKPSALEILEAGRQSGEPLEVTLARANPTGDEFEAYRSWSRNRIEKQEAIARELKRVHAIAKPALDEDPSLTIGEALKVARRHAASWRHDGARHPRSGTVIESYYLIEGGGMLGEVQVEHPLARVEAVEESRVIEEVSA